MMYLERFNFERMLSSKDGRGCGDTLTNDSRISSAETEKGRRGGAGRVMIYEGIWGRS